MKIKETQLDGCHVLKPDIFTDQRGSFFESFHQQKFENLIKYKINFVQDNQSRSKKGVLRGLHYQKGIHSQAKLVRVVKGSVQDVVVDIRPKSKTFGQHFSIILSSKNNEQLFIPKGFAHGFLVLEDDTVFNYKCDNFYNKESESGILYNDEELKINWQSLDIELTLSEKDLHLPKFADITL